MATFLQIICNLSVSDKLYLMSEHSCCKCHVYPSYNEAVNMMENMDSVISFGKDKHWLLCQICEYYICAGCYKVTYEVEDVDLATDIEMYRHAQYVCANCRMVCQYDD